MGSGDADTVIGHGAGEGEVCFRDVEAVHGRGVFCGLDASGVGEVFCVFKGGRLGVEEVCV